MRRVKFGLPTLDHIGRETGTDKSAFQHDFLTFYEAFLGPIRFSTTEVLEVGVKGGASVLAWSRYFPCARIHGWDNKPGPLRAQATLGSGAVTQLADQKSLASLDAACAVADATPRVNATLGASSRGDSGSAGRSVAAAAGGGGGGGGIGHRVVEWDLIVDDGLHSTVTMVNSLAALWPRVRRGGVYVAEDLHACLHGQRGRWCDH